MTTMADMRPQPVDDLSVRKFWREHFPDKPMPHGIHVYDFSLCTNPEVAYENFLVWFNQHKTQGEMICETCEKQRSKAFFFSDTGELTVWTAPGPREGNELLHLLSHYADSLPKRQPSYIR